MALEDDRMQTIRARQGEIDSVERRILGRCRRLPGRRPRRVAHGAHDGYWRGQLDVGYRTNRSEFVEAYPTVSSEPEEVGLNEALRGLEIKM